MGSAADEKKKIVEYMNQTLNNLELKRMELNKKRDAEADPEEVTRIDNDLAILEQQTTTIKGARDDFEAEYKKAKTEEDRKKLERIIKTAILVGITNEAMRQAYEQDKRLQADKMMVRAEIEERAVDRLFATMTFRYVTKDMIEEIKNNAKFHEMAAKDPDRLNREEQELKVEYNNMMRRMLNRAGETMDEDFEKNEEKLRKYFEKKNGFENASANISQFMDEELDNLGDAEDKEAFRFIKKELLEIGAITRANSNKFVNGESSFILGNGFTTELIQREKGLLKVIQDYREQMITKLMKAEEEKMDGTNTTKMTSLYQELLILEGTIKPQIEDDEILSRNNSFRKETEMWKVYQNLPSGSVPTVIRMTKSAKDEMKAWSKLQRMEKVGILEGKGSMLYEMSKWAMGDVQQVLERVLKDDRKITKADKAEIKLKLASVVLYQMVENESRVKDDTPTPNFDKVKYESKNKEFLAGMAKELAESAEFGKIFNNYMKRGNFRDQCVKFLATDAEKKMARQLGAKAPTLTK